jgi:hypothetical protein
VVTQYPLNHETFTYPFSVFCALNTYLFVSQPPVNQNSVFYTSTQQIPALQNFGYFKPLKQSLLFNATLALQPSLARLKLAWQLFAAIIQNTGDNLINYFGFIAANENY